MILKLIDNVHDDNGESDNHSNNSNDNNDNKNTSLELRIILVKAIYVVLKVKSSAHTPGRSYASSTLCKS